MSIDEPVADILARLQGLSAEEILADAAARYPGRVALASSLGVEDQALTHMIADAGLAIPIFTLDTGRLYPETYDLIDRTNKRYGFRMRVYCPDAAEVEKMVARHGINLFRDSEFLRHQCCETRKVKPLRRAQVGLDAWICGLRSGQGVTRDEGGAGGVGRQRRPAEAQSRSPSGTRRACGTTSARTTSPTTRSTTKASRASAARRARAPSPTARTGAPGAGGGRAPNTASAACTRAHAAAPAGDTDGGAS